MTTRSERERLLDILRHISLARDVEQQLESEAASDEIRARTCLLALMYCLIVIGEAVNALGTHLTSKYADVAWHQVVGMRNVLAHEYFQVDAAIVRSTLDQPFAQLERACLALLQ